MDMEAVQERVQQVLSTACNLERSIITPQTSVMELGLDSVSLTVFVTMIEAEFDCELTSHEMMDLFDAAVVDDIISLTARSVLAPRQST